MHATTARVLLPLALLPGESAERTISVAPPPGAGTYDVTVAITPADAPAEGEASPVTP